MRIASLFKYLFHKPEHAIPLLKTKSRLVSIVETVIFAAVKTMIKQLFLWIALLAILPGLLGVGLVHHHCITCNNQQTSITFLLLPHNHHSEPCDCEQAEHVAKACPSVPEHQHQHHSHQCQVDLHKLNIPMQLDQARKLVPSIISLECLYFTTLLLNPGYLQVSLLQANNPEPLPPVFQRYQSPQRLSLNAVYRL